MNRAKNIVAWDTNATDWKATTSGTNLTSNYSGSGMIFAMWTSGSSAPYSVNWEYIVIPEQLWLGLIVAPWLISRIKRKKKVMSN